MKQWVKSAFAFLLAVSMVFGWMAVLAPTKAQATEPGTWISTEDLYIRDPFVLQENGTYYLYGTTGFGQFEVFTSDNLRWWQAQQPCFVGGEDFWGTAAGSSTLEGAEPAYWAPEVHKYNDAYYMFATFTQNTETMNQQASAILKADSPLGPFEVWSEGPITPAGHSCLDATLYFENSVPYLIYAHEWQCACKNYKGVGSMDYIQLSDDLKTTVGDSAELFSADALTSFWEELLGTQASNVTDGPFVYTNASGQNFLLWASSVDVDGTVQYSQLATPFASLTSSINLKNDTLRLYTQNGGHGMVFTSASGEETLVLHTPNSGDTRAKFFHVNSSGSNMSLAAYSNLVNSGYSHYDVSQIEDGKVVYTASTEAALNLNAYANANDDAYIEATLKQGAEFNMSDLRYGFCFAGINFNLVSNGTEVFLQMTDWNFYENYTLTEQQAAAFATDGIRVAAARVDGVYCMYIENDGIMQRVVSKYMPEKANAWFDLKLNAWPNAKGAEYSGLTWNIGDNALPHAVASSDLVLSGFESYDISSLNSGTVIYTGAAEAALELDASVGAHDDVYAETVLKQDAEFNMNDLRYGFRFDNIELNLVSNADGLTLQMTDWNFYENYTLTEQQAVAFASDGIRVGAERSDGIYRMYIESNGQMQCVITKEIPEKANTAFNLKLYTWPNAKGAVYSDLNWKIGNFAAADAYRGKYVSILGDSISTYQGISNVGNVNTTIDDYNAWYNGSWQNVLSSSDDTYWGQVISKYDMKLLVNNSCSGTHLLYPSNFGITIPAGYERVENLAANTGDLIGTQPNIIFLFMGTNDYIGNNTLGDLTEDTYGSVASGDGYITPSTFTEAYIITLEKAMKLYPNAQIYAFTLIPSHYNTDWDVLDAYNARIRQLVKHYENVVLVDIAESSGITTDNYTAYTYDGTHPNDAGIDAIAKVLENAMIRSATTTDVYYMDFEDATGNYLVQDADGLWMDTYDKGWCWVDDEHFLVLSGAEGDATTDFWFNNVPIGTTLSFDFRMPTTSGGWDRLAVAIGSSDLNYSLRFEQWQGWTSIKYPNAEGAEQVINEAFAIDTWYSVKMEWDGDTVSVKLWEKGTAEPADYTFTTQNSGFASDSKVRINYVTNAQSYLHLDNIHFYGEKEAKAYKVQVIQGAGVAAQYETLAEAIANVGDGYIKLMDDVAEEITVDTLRVDLNGRILSGLTVTGTVYALDSYADSYHDTNLGKLTVSGNVASDWVAPNGNRYIAIASEDGSYTMHRVYVGITKLSLDTAVTGFGYKAEFYADDTVKGMMTSQGYSLWLDGGNAIERSKDSFANTLTLRLKNFDIENYGSAKVNAKVSMTLRNGMVIESATASYSMQDMVEIIDTKLDTLSNEQIQAVKTMLEGYDVNWNIPNLLAWEPTTEEA